MNEKMKVAFEHARTIVQQVVTLSTSIILVTIAFSKNFVEANNYVSQTLAISSCVVCLLSILFGIWTLMVITSTINPKDNGKDTKPSIWDIGIRVRAGIQIGLFGIGLFLTIVLGVRIIL